MRVKTEERRQAIVDKAYEVFREVGFDRASMSEIAKRVGGSKATLYSYFKSKEELFITTMRASTEVGDVFKAFKDPALKISSFDELRELLLDFGLKYVRLQTFEDSLAVRRSLIAHSDIPGLGKTVLESGPLQNHMLIASFLGRMMQEGYLREEEPWVAMGHLTQLLEAGLVLPRLLGFIETITPEMIDHAVPRAVGVFLRGYGMPEHLFGSKAQHGGALTKKAEVG